MKRLIIFLCLMPVLAFAAQDGTGTNVFESVRIKDGRSVTFGGETRTNWPDGGSTVYGVIDETAYRGDWGASMSGQVAILNGQVAILNTNTAPLQSFLSVSNLVENGPLITNSTAVAIGKKAYGAPGGVGIGMNATSAAYSVSIGRNSFADLYGVAVGNDAYAAANSVALGYGVANPYENTTMIKGALIIPDGGPTNGAVWIATNTAGIGKWSGPVSFFVQRTADFNFSNLVETTVAWDTERNDYGNCMNTTNFVAPVDGIYSFNTQLSTAKVSGGTPTYTRASIEVNGFDITGTYVLNLSTDDGACYIGCSLGNYYLTRGARVGVQVRTQTTAMTNKLSSGIFKSYFSGSLIRELP